MSKEIYPIDILTSSGRYPDREKSEECTGEVRVNAADLAERVTKLLNELEFNTTVTSGFRTQAANKSTNGAKRSAHMMGKACDLFDPQGAIANAIMAKLPLLEKYDLYLENPQYTKTSSGGWVHLQTQKTRSGNRVFNP